MRIYKEIIKAKNGSEIPVFVSGKTMESRYNPERDAENLLNTINEEAEFFLVLGAGSGIFLKQLSEKFFQSKILCVELYREDIDFLIRLSLIKMLAETKRVIFCCLEDFENCLMQNYLPAKYGTLKILEERAWINENQSQLEKIKSILNKTLGLISADYSVQSHFGKIWTSNILNNARLAEQYNSQAFKNHISGNLNKTAVIVAAGPSLDKTISTISKNRNNYFLIATDTAGQSLLKRNIFPDIIVSIDAQAVSYNHFINRKIKDKKTIFAFDLASNFSAARHICKSGNEVFFFTSGHPLASAINLSCNSPLPHYFSGAGTVTITALDLAIEAGFKDILILGADFSYINSKAYTKGTYLDSLYNKNSSKTKEAEKSFSSLMFRTELIKLNQKKNTTQILEAYKNSMENYLKEKNISFTKEGDIYKLQNSAGAASLADDKNSFSPSSFSLKPFFNKLKTSSIEDAEIFLLPYVAWLRNNIKYKDINYKDLLKLALESIVSYNI